VQACIKVGEKVRFVSVSPYFVVSHGNPNTADIVVSALDSMEPSSLGDDDASGGEGSALERAIHVTLCGECRISEAGYDRINVARASDILPPELLSGPYHKVREEVSFRGPQYFFRVDSDFGPFQAQGVPRLRRLVREIYAIHALREVANSESFRRALKDSALSPFVGLKDLLVNPVDTVSGVPTGIATFVKGSEAGFGKGRSNYEDDYVKALVTVSKYKRRFADELRIDVYTSNPEVQKELNRLGWAAALGNWTPGVLLLPVSGPGNTLYSAFGWVETFNRIITEKAPDVLRAQNKKILKEMDIPKELIDRFLSHPFYSPRNHTVITENLRVMKDAKGRDRVIERALEAKSEIDAFTCQQFVEILAGYHQSESPVTLIDLHKGIPVGYAKNGSLVLGFPVDLGRWTRFSEYLFDDFGSPENTSRDVALPELWITGRLTPRTGRELRNRGIKMTENADAKLGSMD
jgi:hypothetical protein